MKVKLTFLGMLCLMQASLVGPAFSAGSSKNPERELPALKESLLRGEIRRIEVFYYPAKGETRAAITPSRLERIYEQKLLIRLPSRSSKIRVLPDVLEKTRVSPPTDIMMSRGSRDFRTGCVFYKAEGSRALSLYIDGRGTMALIDGNLVTLDGELYHWLRTLPGAVKSDVRPPVKRTRP